MQVWDCRARLSGLKGTADRCLWYNLVMLDQRIGEVIEASSTMFAAQCDRLHEPPALGSLVTVHDGDVHAYALVSYAETLSIEPGRQPVSRGIGLTDQDDVYRRHPELSQLLRTVFSALVVGYKDRNHLRTYLPPRPARVHAFVYPTDAAEQRAISTGLTFLSTLLQNSAPTGDEFIAASLRSLSVVHPDPDTFLVETGRQLAVYLRGDTARLQALLLRLR